jgi:hypothetical protein
MAPYGVDVLTRLRKWSNAQMSDTAVTTPRARLAFPALFEPRGFNDQPKKYSAVLIFDKAAQATAEFQNMKKAATAAAKAKFGDKPPKSMKNPFRDAGEKDDLPGFEEGSVFITISSKRQPKIVDRRKVDGKFPLITDEDRLYPGCFVRASVNAFGYDNSGNRGVSFGLNNMQFLDDGERIATGGGGNPESDFDDADGENVSEGDAASIF